MSVREVMSEVETLRALKNDAVLNLIEYYFVESESWVYVITDILYGGAVLDAILKMKDERYTEAEAKVVVQRVLVGIEYMHSNLVVHRDLKVRISHPPHSAA
jgi:serine/threonine protein kinase